MCTLSASGAFMLHVLAEQRASVPEIRHSSQTLRFAMSGSDIKVACSDGLVVLCLPSSFVIAGVDATDGATIVLAAPVSDMFSVTLSGGSTVLLNPSLFDVLTLVSRGRERNTFSCSGRVECKNLALRCDAPSVIAGLIVTGQIASIINSICNAIEIMIRRCTVLSFEGLSSPQVTVVRDVA